MTTKEVYTKLASGAIQVNTALALSLVNSHLSIDEEEWVQKELNGYPSKESVPDYRQISCEIKARVQNRINGVFQEIRLKGGSLESLDTMLQTNFGLSVYRMYITQGVESIEQQILGHNEGDFIMLFEGGPAQELKDSLKSQEQKYSFSTMSVYQSAPLAYLQHSLTVIKSKLLAILQKHIIDDTENIGCRIESSEKRKIVFLSYCWEDEEHEKWVKHLANDLKAFFDVRLDQNLPFGVELTAFMEQAVAESDKVLIIATPEYKRRADGRIRGVGVETSLITSDLVTDQNRIKFIPIIRKGTPATSYPRFLGTRKGADMTDDTKYDEVFEELKNNLLEH